MDWPLTDAAMVRNFGYNDRGRPVPGTVFEGEGEIFAADAGEVIFSTSGKEFSSRLPSPLGAWDAIDHGDGLIGIYGRHASTTESRQFTQVDKGLAIAPAGSSGWSLRNGLYFVLYDRKERRWINPSMVIIPFSDTVPPQIAGVYLRRMADGELLEGARLRSLTQGRYAIVVNAADSPAPGRMPLAPHRIVCSVNGEEAGLLSFETLCARDGMVMVNRNGLVPALQAYAHYPAFEVGEVHLSRGQAILEVIVQDIVGNSRSSVIRMLVE